MHQIHNSERSTHVHQSNNMQTLYFVTRFVQTLGTSVEVNCRKETCATYSIASPLGTEMEIYRPPVWVNEAKESGLVKEHVCHQR